MRYILRRSIAALAVFLVAAAAPAAEERQAILVFGAASLANVLDEMGQAYTARSHVPVKGAYAASSVLAKQIEAGAPADVFFSADTDWVDYLDQHKLLQRDSRRNLLGNRLVLIAPVASRVQVRIAPRFDLAGALGDGKLATGDPDSVPVGKYAQAALTKLGVWDQLTGKLVRAENVRAALAFVDRGEAPLGIVYQTDAQADPGVRVVDVFPQDSHPPITYPVALTVNAQPAAAKYVAFLESAAGAKIFRKYGFQTLP
jgi:molybdate transport system substrate-binding protein